MRQEFVVWGTLDGANEYTNACRSHHMSGAQMKRDNQQVVRWAVKAAALKPMRCPVAVHITWVEGLRPGRKRFVPRDRDNIAFARKFILDALRAEGVISDDSWADVLDTGNSYMLNRNDPKIIVELEEV
ncbi:hypothetical protein [Adlercreutzia caecimuris]|uniref:hypothetical protein n=1 Tax=Adlercreutzia caecimuris TaxID=671266 RepID=UPI002585FAAE|nr:hypothetical protein [Adlercreutzia caecimuris]